MKLIISLMDGAVNMVSVNRLRALEFKADCIHIVDDVTGSEHIYYYRDIRSIVIA